MHSALPAFLLLAAALPAAAAPMTKGERQRLLAHLEMTTAWLADEVQSLSPAQLNYKPSSDVWSVLNVVEHLTIAEPQYWQWLREGLKEAPPETKGNTTDEAILWYGIDRTERSKTAEARTAKSELTDLNKGLAAFRKLRAEMIDYARATEDDLRGHRVQKSQTDLYQWFLMISTHSQRHILQIREIKANAAFPKK